MTTATTMKSNKERSDGFKKRSNKFVAMFIILKTAITIITHAVRTRIHNLQSGRSFVLNVLTVLCCF